jgi:hypothetical protein
MRLLKELAALVFWFTLWTAIPAALLYPLAIWTVDHTNISGDAIAKSYIFAIALLFLPTGFLVDVMYRRIVFDRRGMKPTDVSKGPI